VPYVIVLILLALATVDASVVLSCLLCHGDRTPRPPMPRHRPKRDPYAPVIRHGSPRERWLHGA
jgi:hypothetical protein